MIPNAIKRLYLHRYKHRITGPMRLYNHNSNRYISFSFSYRFEYSVLLPAYDYTSKYDCTIYFYPIDIK